LPSEWAETAAACAGRSVFGLPYESPEALYRDAADAVEAVRRLWDSWEDDAIIRDVPTGRFIDRSKLHFVDVKGAYFSIGAASIVPRPPQGQPVVAVEGRDAHGVALAASHADVVFLSPESGGNEWSTRLCGWDAANECDGSCRAYADILVAFENGADPVGPTFRGTPAALVEYLIAGHCAGWQGVRLKPHDLQRDLASIVEFVVPRLQAAGVFRATYDDSTLRNRLALPIATNRYEVAS
jgi:alkanesulfonate monooxygenase SsuD/methylene tetrahydromethanopterin reductase-like flavin-dependent oxidoreductase (luciferase family)